jgi:hypothetical protein
MMVWEIAWPLVCEHEEVLCVGEVYYLAPGHIPVVEEPLEIVEFSPLADHERTTAALMASVRKHHGLVALSVSGPGWRPRHAMAGSCCWSAGLRLGKPGAWRRRSRRCCQTGGWCTRPTRPRSSNWRPRHHRRRWCGWMSCRTTWTASMDCRYMGTRGAATARSPISGSLLAAPSASSSVFSPVVSLC